MRIKANQKLGVRVIMRAMEEPLRQIANNAGLEGSVVIDTVCAWTPPVVRCSASSAQARPTGPLAVHKVFIPISLIQDGLPPEPFPRPTRCKPHAAFG